MCGRTGALARAYQAPALPTRASLAWTNGAWGGPDAVRIGRAAPRRGRPVRRGPAAAARRHRYDRFRKASNPRRQRTA